MLKYWLTFLTVVKKIKAMEGLQTVPINSFTPGRPPIDLDSIPDHSECQHKGIDPREVADLKSRGYSLGKIAKYLGVSKQTVKYHLDKQGKIYPVASQFFADRKPEILEGLQEKLIESITQDKLKSISAGSSITGIAILEDKIRLIRGQTTQNVGVAGQINHLLANPDDMRAVQEASMADRKARLFEVVPTSQGLEPSQTG